MIQIRRLSFTFATLFLLSACGGERASFPAPKAGQADAGAEDDSDTAKGAHTPSRDEDEDAENDDGTEDDGPASSSSHLGTSPSAQMPPGAFPTSSSVDAEDPTSNGGAPGTGGSNTPAATTTPPPGAELSLGELCRDDGSCDSGLCVDGVCCNARCDDLCEVCNLEGAKGLCAVPDTDAACGTLSCPEASECRTYSSSVLAGNCAGRGECATAADCPAVDSPEGTPCNGAEGQCDGAGECVVANKAGLGDACEGDDQCSSGHCVDGACCDTACDGVCAACGEDGRCDVAPDDDDECNDVSCPESSECASYPEPLTEKRCKSLGQCETEATYCNAELAEEGASCGSNQACNAEGECAAAEGDTDDTGEETSEGDDTGGETECGDDEVLCDGDCIQPATDLAYCGAYDDCSGEAAGEECAAGGSCVWGECRGWQEATVLVDDDALTIFTPLGAMTRAGMALVAWQQYPDADNTQSSVRARFGATWEPEWSDEEIVFDHDASKHPALDSVVALGDDLVVLGSEYDEETGVTLNWSRVWNSSTEDWDEPQTIQAANETGYSFMPVVSARGGTGVITWNQLSSDNDSYDVWVRVWNGAEHSWGDATRLEDEGDIRSQIPVAAISQDGEIFVLWQQQAEPDGPINDLWGARFDGEDWADFEMLGVIEGHGSGFSLVANNQGDVIGVWQGLWLGTVWSGGAWQTVEAEGAWFGGALCDIQDGSGDAVLYWSVGGDGAYTQRFDGIEGQLADDPLQVASGENGASVIVGCGWGTAFASWLDDSTINHAARWNPEDNAWDEAIEISDEEAGVVTSLSISGDGSALAVWPKTLEYGAGGVVAAFYH